ncbi:MAG TPA: thiamine pyrophosphate-dependent enzyme [Syntrophales bacterium]|nr:thiamine pyrophosphate-dependent enzyme [Syntrophales bacterium]
MSSSALGTYAPNTWCPGCGNFAILNGMKTVLKDLAEGVCPPENVVIVSGIGCHGKIVDYLDVNSFYAIHGRAIPVAEGIKIARPELKVICFCGDGDAYGEGIEHLIFAAKRNVDITVVVHNNRVYSLTAFQYSPTSPAGFKGRSTPLGSVEAPINPLELLLAGRASFLARGTSRGMTQLTHLFREAVVHRGFALVDVLQVCATYNNLYDYYARKVYDLQDHDPCDRTAALARIREWDYNSDARIALGILYRAEAATFEETFPASPPDGRDRDGRIRAFLDRSA